MVIYCENCDFLLVFVSVMMFKIGKIVKESFISRLNPFIENSVNDIKFNKHQQISTKSTVDNITWRCNASPCIWTGGGTL